MRCPGPADPIPFSSERCGPVGILGMGGMGGSGKVAREVAAGLGVAGLDVCYLSSKSPYWGTPDGSISRYRAVAAPRTPEAPSKAWIRPLAADLVRIATSEGLAVLNVHYVAGMLEAALQARDTLAARGHRLAVVATLHGSDVTTWGAHAPTGVQLSAQVRATDGVTAVSHWLADRASEVFGLNHRPQVIPNSVDVECFGPAAVNGLRRLLSRDGQLLLVHVSNLRPVKRPLDTLEVLAAVRRAGLDARLVVVGDGPLAGEMRRRSAASDLAGHVHFAGVQSPRQVQRYVAASDLMLITSTSESFCLAALESLACGVPFVSSGCGGPAELLASDDNMSAYAHRLLSPVGEIREMSEKVIDLVSDLRSYDQLCRWSLSLPRNRFPRRVQIEKYARAVSAAGGTAIAPAQAAQSVVGP